MNVKNRDECVNIIKWPMIAAGLWPREVSKNTIISKLNFIYSIIARLIWFCFYFGLVIELVRLIVQKYTLTEVLASFTVVITASKISVILVIYFKNNVWYLLDQVTKKEDETWKEGDREIEAIFLRKIRIPKLFARLLWIFTALTVSSINISGMFSNHNLILYNNANNVSIESHYLYQFWFPANKLDHVVPVTIISCVLAYGAGVYNVTTNLIMVVLCTHSAIHLSILQHRLRNYIPEDFEEEQMDEAILTLTGFVIKHRYLIAYTEHVNKCCKNIIMMEFVLTSIDVAIGALNIIKINLSDIGWLVFYLPMLVIQIYSFSWSVNEVMVQSQAVGSAAYQSRWYLLNKKGKMLTRLIIQRAYERPLKMTIGPFGPMTMESFLMIMKGAYTYVSIMRK